MPEPPEEKCDPTLELIRVRVHSPTICHLRGMANLIHRPVWAVAVTTRFRRRRRMRITSAACHGDPAIGSRPYNVNLPFVFLSILLYFRHLIPPKSSHDIPGTVYTNMFQRAPTSVCVRPDRRFWRAGRHDIRPFCWRKVAAVGRQLLDIKSAMSFRPTRRDATPTFQIRG